MADDILKSFLVGIGFKVDKQGERKLTETISNITRQAGVLALALEAAALAAAVAVAKIAASFDQLYYTSQRTGASVQNIKGLGYAFSQVGSSSGQAVAALEAYAKAIRTNPGVGGFVRSLGVKQTGDAFKDLSASVDAILKRHPYHTGAQLAAILGLSEEQFQTFSKYRKEIAEFKAEYDATAKRVGLNNEEAAKASNAFMRALTSLQASVTAVAQKIGTDLLPVMTRYLRDIQVWIERHPQEIEDAIKAIGAAALALAVAFADIAKALAPVALGFQKIVAGLTGHDGLQSSMEAFAVFLTTVWVAKILGAFGLIGGGWAGLLLKLGIGGALALHGASDEKRGVVHGGIPHRQDWRGPADELPGLGNDAELDGTGSAKSGIFNRARRAIARRLGKGGGPGAGEGTQARPPEASGKYRPVYKLSAQDLDQATINTIAGEARLSDPASLDGVINNMLNRVGSKGWGPSGNLRQVARAPGQYEGYRQATAAETEKIKARIVAIASGGVPDNTGGANSFRSEAYYRGEGANRTWARTSKMGPNVGGNRYAFVPGIANGPYAPYKTPGSGQAPTAPSFNFPKAGFSPGGFDVNALGNTPPLGGTTNNQTSSVTMTAPTTIKIEGSSDPAATGAHVERAMNRVNDLSLRNVRGAIR